MKMLKLLIVVAVLAINVGTARGNEQSEVRQTVERVFQQLKSKDYSGLYDVLPGASRSRMSRDRFVNALQRAQDIYELDRLEIGTIRVVKELAVVDTVLYGRVIKPFETEGKIVVQQYLVKEEGRWRVATGDQSTVKKFLANNPGFQKGFKIRQPRVFVKQNGNWVEFGPPQKNQPKTD